MTRSPPPTRFFVRGMKRTVFQMSASAAPASSIPLPFKYPTSNRKISIIFSITCVDRQKLAPYSQALADFSETWIHSNSASAVWPVPPAPKPVRRGPSNRQRKALSAVESGRIGGRAVHPGPNRAPSAPKPSSPHHRKLHLRLPFGHNWSATSLHAIVQRVTVATPSRNARFARIRTVLDRFLSAGRKGDSSRAGASEHHSHRWRRSSCRGSTSAIVNTTQCPAATPHYEERYD